MSFGTVTDRSDTYNDFLLTLYSKHEPISYRFRDKRRFQSKIANFSHPRVFNAPPHADRVSLGIGYRRKGSKTRMMVLPDGRRSLQTGLAVKTQHRCVSDRQTHRRTPYDSKDRRWAQAQDHPQRNRMQRLIKYPFLSIYQPIQSEALLKSVSK